MIQNASSAREIIDSIVKQSGITKKLAAEILHTIPAIIEEGLKKDGEVRVKGLGTFRLRWTRGRIGRNPQTGERVEITSHNRVVFLPEQAFKEYINRDNRLLSYKIIPSADKVPSVEETSPEAEPEPLAMPMIKVADPEPGPPADHQYQPDIQPQPEPKPEPPAESESGAETGTEPPPKRRVHWIVPVAISVIVILSLVFYFRNFYLREDGSQKTEVIREKIEVSSQKTEVKRPVTSPPKAEEGTALESVKQAIKETQNEELIPVPEGTRLFKLAREIYDNPYLWVLIYKENVDKITDPDMVISGSELVIPVLEGIPGRLTRNDSLAVSEGYRLVYEFYKAKDESKARDFARAMKRYEPKQIQ